MMRARTFFGCKLLGEALMADDLDLALDLDLGFFVVGLIALSFLSLADFGLGLVAAVCEDLSLRDGLLALRLRGVTISAFLLLLLRLLSVEDS